MHNGAIFHASDYLLAKIENVQQSFLRELGVSEGDAYLSHNFAPPKLRRNIGILGLLHKRVLGESHPIFKKLFPLSTEIGRPLLPGGHSRQLYGHLHEVHFQMTLYCKSIFAMTYVYNMLPQHVVDSSSVTEFQKHLSILARRKCALGDETWRDSFSSRAR